MSYEEYWEKDADLVKSYRKAYEMKQELDNQRMWLQGMYNYKAVATAIAQAFGEKQGQREKYFEYPIPLTENERLMEKERNVKKTMEWVTKGQK